MRDPPGRTVVIPAGARLSIPHSTSNGDASIEARMLSPENGLRIPLSRVRGRGRLIEQKRQNSNSPTSSSSSFDNNVVGSSPKTREMATQTVWQINPKSPEPNLDVGQSEQEPPQQNGVSQCPKKTRRQYIRELLERKATSDNSTSDDCEASSTSSAGGDLAEKPQEPLVAAKVEPKEESVSLSVNEASSSLLNTSQSHNGEASSLLQVTQSSNVSAASSGQGRPNRRDVILAKIRRLRENRVVGSTPAAQTNGLSSPEVPSDSSESHVQISPQPVQNCSSRSSSADADRARNVSDLPVAQSSSGHPENGAVQSTSLLDPARIQALIAEPPPKNSPSNGSEKPKVETKLLLFPPQEKRDHKNVFREGYALLITPAGARLDPPHVFKDKNKKTNRQQSPRPANNNNYRSNGTPDRRYNNNSEVRNISNINRYKGQESSGAVDEEDPADAWTYTEEVNWEVPAAPTSTSTPVVETKVNSMVEEPSFVCSPIEEFEEPWDEDTPTNSKANEKGNRAPAGRPLLRVEPIRQQILQQKFGNLLIHGPSPIVKPVKSADELPFEPETASALKSMGRSDGSEVESFAWPALMRGLNVCIIGDVDKSVLSYSVPLCSNIVERRMPVDEEEEETDGAMGGESATKEVAKVKNSSSAATSVLVLCYDGRRCNEVLDTFNALVQGLREKVTVKILDPESGAMETVDILISTPAMLVGYLETHGDILDGLHHVVLEDCDAVLKDNPEQVKTILNRLQEVAIHRPTRRKIQMVVVADKWSLDIQKLIRRLESTPQVCFANYLEAALSGNILFKRKVAKKVAHKTFIVEDTVKRLYNTRKTVLFCDESEVAALTEHLMMRGVETMVISKQMEPYHVRENVAVWNSLRNGECRVLICSDDIFEVMPCRVTQGDWLVHYTIPEDYGRFARRFESVSDSLQSPLAVEENTNQCRCLLILDDSSENSPTITNLYEGLSRSIRSHFEL